MKNNKIRNEELGMRNEKSKKGYLRGIFAFFTFLFSLIFCIGCLNPFEPQLERGKQSAAGYGYFAVSINENEGRTIQPLTDQTYFVKYRLEFYPAGSTETREKTVLLDPDQLDSNQLAKFIELPVGDYDLVVTAYVNWDDDDDTLNEAVAEGELKNIKVEAGETSGGSVKLTAIERGFGTFSWQISFSAEITAQMTIAPLVDSGQTPTRVLTLVDTPSGTTQAGKDDALTLRSGSYRVTFDLTDSEGRKLQRSEILHVYQNMISHFGPEVFRAEYFIIKRVQKIELEEAEVETYIELPLVKKITPPDATLRDVVWEIIDDPDGTDAVIEDGVFYAEKAKLGDSIVTIRATIEHGKGYGKDYVEEIPVTVKFVQIKEIELNLDEFIEKYGEEKIIMDDGTEYLLTAKKIEPWNASNRKLNWKLDDEEIAEINGETGLIKALKPGFSFASATADSNSAVFVTCEIEVLEVPITDITLPVKIMYLPEGTKTKVKALFAPPNATDKVLVWTSDTPTKVKVDQEGNLEVFTGAYDMDQVTITVEGDKGKISTFFDIYIRKPGQGTIIDSFKFETNFMRLPMGSTKILNYFIMPEGAKTEVLYATGDTAIATVGTDGKITPLELGRVMITATTLDGGRADECLVEIYDPEVNGPALTAFSLNKTELTLRVGSPDQLLPEFDPPDAKYQNLTWVSSDTSRVTVDKDGNLKPLLATLDGQPVIIKVITEDSAFTASCAVTVINVPVESITLNAQLIRMGTGSTKAVKLLVTVYPAAATDKRLQWWSDNDNNATVAADGTVTYITGSTYINVKSLDPGAIGTSAEIQKRCLIQGLSDTPAVAGVKLHTKTLNIAMGKTAQLKATITPDNANNPLLYWYSDNIGVATVPVNGDGTITPVSTGTARIIIMSQDGGYTDYCDVTVYEGAMATKITLNTNKLTLRRGSSATLNGKTAQLIATVVGHGPSDAVIWTSANTNYVTVSTTGLVTTVGTSGTNTTTITATSLEGGHTATCEVTVSPNEIVVTKVRLSADYLNLEEKETATLTPYKEPVTAVTDIVWYSVDPTVASVNTAGVVTGEKAGGTTRIYATTVNGGFWADCAVTVRAKGTDGPAVSSVELNINAMNMTVASGVYRPTLYAFTKPIIDEQIESTAANQSVFWSSSDMTIATVNSNGAITALKTGTANIMATTIDGGHTDVCVVTVVSNNGGVNGLSLNMKQLTLSTRLKVETGELQTGEIKLTVGGASSDSYRRVKYYNSNPAVATVNETNNIVTAHKAGETVIMITTGYQGYTQRVNVKVVQEGIGENSPAIQSVTRVVMNPTSLLVTYSTPVPKITATVSPALTPNKEVVWTSSNAGIAAVDNNGVVTGLRIGTAVISATSVDGGKIGTCSVEVRDPQKRIPGHAYGDFYIGTCEVTQIAWQSYMTPVSNGISATPSSFSSNPAGGETQNRRPVDSVSWFDALVFCNRLSVQGGLTPAYEIPDQNNAWNAATWTNYTTDTTRWGNAPTGTDINSDTNHFTRWSQARIVADSTGYRLPTVSQWNYALNPGGMRYFWGDDWSENWGGGYILYHVVEYAWVEFFEDGISMTEEKTHEVGRKRANPLGLYDMYGNLSEWCWDVRGPTLRSRVGGQWSSSANYPLPISITDSQGTYTMSYRRNFIGLRLVRPAP